jgi:hypothetical protein
VAVWGKPKNATRQSINSRHAPESWIRVQPELRIVPETITQAVDARRAAMHKRSLRLSNGRLMGCPPGEGALPADGRLTCDVCGGMWC